MKPQVPTSITILIFVLVGPPIGTLIFLLVIGLPPGLCEGTGALVSIGIGYLVGLLPALGAACLAIVFSSRSFWPRVLLTGFVGGGGGEFVARLFIQTNWDSLGPHVHAAFGLSGIAGTFAAVAASELWRTYRKPPIAGVR